MRRLKHLWIGAALTLAIAGCSNVNYQKPADPLEAGRDFIRATLDANFSVADKYPLHDSLNSHLYERYKDWFSKLPSEEKSEYKHATININKVDKVNDSTTIIDFSNTYKKEPLEIKMIKTRNQWWVDFQYTFAGKLPTDSTSH